MLWPVFAETDRLCVRALHPGDVHIVLTTGSVIAYGQHFFSSAHLVKTVGAMVHAMFTEHYTTNTAHMPFYRVVLRFLPCWLHFLEADNESESSDGYWEFHCTRTRMINVGCYRSVAESRQEL